MNARLLKFKQIGAALAFGLAGLPAGQALANDISFMVFPNVQAVPLMVLQAKVDTFLPEGSKVVLTHPEHNPKAIKQFLAGKKSDFVSFNMNMGVKLYQGGLKNLKLAGVHVWGGVGILSKAEIKPGDWSALKGKKGLIVPGKKSPPGMVSMKAMKLNGINPGMDLEIGEANPHKSFQQMMKKEAAPDFVVIPEPQLSHGLVNMKKMGWEQKYHVFADSARSISAFGLPMGSLWAVRDVDDAASILKGFERAVAYTMNPANRAEVAKIVSEGFKREFGKKPGPDVFEAMLGRGIVKMRFKDAAAISTKLNMVWAMNGFFPDSEIFYRARAYNVPNAAFLTSNMLPRHVGLVLAHGDEMGVTHKTKMAALKIRIGAHEQMAKQMKVYRKLEMDILAAYQADDFAKIDELLQKLAAHNLETSRVQIKCIQQTRTWYDPEDLTKLKAFMAENTNMIANYNYF